MAANHKAKVLIVDDNAGMARTTAMILKMKGYHATMALSGQEALTRMRERPYDIVLMDIKMPAMDGVETFKRLKIIRPGAVVIMMTAYAVEELVQEALAEGAFGVIYKPLDIDQVTGLIEEAMTHREGALIMVVDDDIDLSSLLRKIFVRKGYRVELAETGEEAVDLAQAQTYDILFVELVLPGANGLETYLAIKAVNPDVVAVMMTRREEEAAELIEAAFQNNAYACLYKPLDIEKVLSLVQEIGQRPANKARS